MAVSMAASARAADERGLALRIEPIGGGESDTREARLVALHVPAGTAPSPFVAAGRFRATWSGNLNLKVRERYSFSAEGRGKLVVRIDDKPVFEASGDDLPKTPAGEAVRLKKGANKLEVVYESPESGDATVRLLWSQPKLPPQAPAPGVYSHDAAAPDTAKGRTLRGGRQLAAEMRCTKCHAVSAGDAFPELAMDAPSFADIGGRLNREWVAAWIHDPKAIRPDARMPKVFHAGNAPAGGGGADTRAADVAAYLGTLRSAVPQPAPASTPELVTAGERLYAALACVACHVPPGAANAAKEPARVSHDHVAAKFTPVGLKQYLLKPDAHYAWNPMPDFKLSDAEATQLAAYLLSAGTKPLEASAPNADKGDARRGEQLVASSGCLSCHAGVERPTELKAAALADITGADAWSRGCMGADQASHRAAPVFNVTDDQRAAIVAFAATDRSALTRDNPAEFAERQYVEMRCGHCHARDGVEPALTTALSKEHDAAYARFFAADAHHEGGAKPAGDAASAGVHLAPDQKTFPQLTWTGDKLRPEWSAAFIAGEVPDKPRPYLRARMPAFKARARGIDGGFAMTHGRPPASPPIPAPDPALAAIGQKLVGAVGGFSCVQCHAVAGAPPLAPFEAPAVDFMYARERLQKDYYLWWMHDPIAIDRTTKMPRFGDDEGKTPLRDTFNGDAAKQFDAIWHYLLQGKDVKR
jgi:mono/diheme cytochrome c family protein